MPRFFTLILIALGVSIAVVDGTLWRTRPARTVKAARVRPSRVVADAFMEVLCRTPMDQETVDWDTRPVDHDSLVAALNAMDEARRVREIRGVYVELLKRQPGDADCPQIHDWAARGFDVSRATRALDASPEARRVAQVSAVITDMTGEDPRGWDDAGLRRWVDGPLTIAEIRSRLRASRPLVGVHYFGWYQPSREGWRNDLTTVPADAPRPAIGEYDSGDTAVVDTQIEEIEDAGFDFVIVHVIAQSERTWRNAHRFFEELAGHRLKAAIMLDGLNAEASASKAMWTTKAIGEFARDAHYFHLHGEPLVMLFSAPIDFDVPGIVLRDVYWTDRYDAGRNTFNPSSQLYPYDWPFWAPTPPPAVNGVVAVVPGYTDASLRRARTMVHPRANGQFYRGQWERALVLHPDLILVYSWNEYFEQTAIEPTDAWGRQYLEMTACFIAHAHRGTTGSC